MTISDRALLELVRATAAQIEVPPEASGKVVAAIVAKRLERFPETLSRSLQSDLDALAAKVCAAPEVYAAYDGEWRPCPGEAALTATSWGGLAVMFLCYARPELLADDGLQADRSLKYLNAGLRARDKALAGDLEALADRRLAEAAARCPI